MTGKDEVRSFIDDLIEKGYNIPEFDLGNKFNNKLYYNTPYYDKEELVEFINTFLFGKWAAGGVEVQRFEKEFSTVVRNKHSLMVNSGSSANLVLFAALKERFNWEDGSEIIISNAGFSTSYSAIILNNLIPVFIDIELDTFNFDLGLIESKITEKTKAIFTSPMLGNPPDLYELEYICDRYNLVHILDGCDSLGTLWSNVPIQVSADASTCSLYMAHQISAIQGGVISTDDDKLYELCRSYSAWGNSCTCKSTGNTLPNGVCGKRFSDWLGNGTVTDHKYIYGRAGYNTQPSLDAQGSLARVQLRKLPQIVGKRINSKKRAQYLFEKYIPNVYIPDEYSNEYKVSWFATPIRTKDKTNLVSYLESRGVQTRNYFCNSAVEQPFLRKYGDPKDFPNSRILAEEVFFIGANPNWDERHFSYLEEILKEYKNG